MITEATARRALKVTNRHVHYFKERTKEEKSKPHNDLMVDTYRDFTQDQVAILRCVRKQIPARREKIIKGELFRRCVCGMEIKEYFCYCPACGQRLEDTKESKGLIKYRRLGK